MRQRLQLLDQRGELDRQERRSALAFAALCMADDEALLLCAEALLEGGAQPDFLRELCLQGIAYCGFPRALHGLFCLAGLLGTTTPGAEPELSAAALRTRGLAYFDSVYASSADKLRAKVAALDPRFEELVTDVAYGRILARAGIPPKLRELCGVAGLTVLGHEAQMLSHAFGALRNGAERSEVLELIDSLQAFWPDLPRAHHRKLLADKLG